MNKAFVKEPDEPGNRCPKCGAIGTAVYQVTLRAQLPANLQEQFRGSAYFCPQPTCDVAYFDSLERTVAVACLDAPVYLKDPDAPICPCFGFTCSEIEADVNEGVVRRVKAHVGRANSDEASCETKSADGRSCVAAVQRYFMRLRATL